MGRAESRRDRIREPAAHYSLLEREIEAEILPTCAQRGIGAITYGPLASGILAGRYRPGVAPEPGSRMHQWLSYDMPAAAQWVTAMTTDRNYAIADTVAQIAADLDTTSAAVAIAWIAQRCRINAVTLGPRNREQLHFNLAGLRTELPVEVIERLTEISAPTNHPVTGVPIAMPAREPGCHWSKSRSANLTHRSLVAASRRTVSGTAPR